jgi:hypothetical protein
VFDAAESSDFDWLERAIIQYGYYEHAGVWNFGVDVDKRVVAEMVAAFAPERALELGCAAGAVIECLGALGVSADGVEISSMAIAQASASVRERIHHGDLLALDLLPIYDMAFGLDVFEHLNPNRLDAYIERLVQLTRPDSYLFCNIPAFGHDSIFGTVFPFYIDGWREAAASGRFFSTIHVDDLGFPLHGHLTWASADWWVQRFEHRGFRRDVAIEREFHRKYDDYFDKRSRARKAFFVFSKETASKRQTQIIQRIRAERSNVLHS